MRIFDGTSADLVWQNAIRELIDNPDHNHCGRNSKTREILPSVLKISDPRQRWILSRVPPYNPAYGLVEFIWIITGKNASQVLNFWNPTLPMFTGNEPTYHGAYGYRLRSAFGIDQIERAYLALLNSPESRQVVLQIWKPEIDFPSINGDPVSKDIPCNVVSFLKIRDAHLHWSQIMRSNDIIRGLPYNIIQFTMIQEIMAGWLKVELGDYIHLSDSLHIYENDIPRFSCHPRVYRKFDRELFSMAYKESMGMFESIYEDLHEISNGMVSEARLKKIFLSERYNRSGTLIQDMMAVIGSDTARRYKCHELSIDMAMSCKDHNLKQASLDWLMYQKEKQ